jgi:adenylosuccinate synthase
MIKQAFVVAGLTWGDEGKGSVIDFLVRETGADMVVRFNGGPQAAHNVLTPEGRHHTFASLGSGSFVKGTRTYLSRFMMIEPLAFVREMEIFEINAGFRPKVYVEAGCPVILPCHWRLNRIREEERGEAKHGACGMGIGELRSDIEAGLAVLRAGDLHDATETKRITAVIQELKAPETRAFARIPWRGSTDYRPFLDYVDIVPDGSLESIAGDRSRETVIFEGAQGLLLDEIHGYAPYNTWSDCTFRNADRLLEGMKCKTTKIGVMRSYMTRHGPGPFPTEDTSIQWPDHNKENDWQGAFRQGHLDLSLFRYAAQRIGHLDGLAATCLDRARGSLCADRGFLQGENLWKQPPKPSEMVPFNVKLLKIPLLIESYGPTALDKHANWEVVYGRGKRHTSGPVDAVGVAEGVPGDLG